MEDTKFIGRIYKISSPQTCKIYIGSTIHQLKVRFTKHKSSYKSYSSGKGHYEASFEIVQYEDAKIELFYEGLFKTKQELHTLEGEVIGTLDNTCNKQIAGRGRLEVCRAYRKKHVDIINEQFTCAICNGSFTKSRKANHEKTQKHQKALSLTLSSID